MQIISAEIPDHRDLLKTHLYTPASLGKVVFFVHWDMVDRYVFRRSMIFHLRFQCETFVIVERSLL